MRSRRILLVGAVGLLLGPASALTQVGQQPGGGGAPGGGFPGGGFGRGFPGGGFRGMMNQDPAQRWDQMTGGKDVWVRTEITDQRQQFFFDMIARGLNVSDGKITRQQYMDWSEQMRQRFQAGGFGRGPGGPSGPAGGAQGGAGPGGGPGGNPDAFAEVRFRQLDKNGDGYLNYDEMPDNLKAEWQKWDTDKNGLIDLNEFKAFLRGRVDQIRSEIRANAPTSGVPGGFSPGMSLLPTAPAAIEEEEPKRVVYRAGKLPKELPPWFAQYDKDGDGQIGLWEWRAAGQPLDRFLAMDRNGDGFLTVEEVLRYEAEQNKARGGNAMAANNGNGAGGFGRRNGGGFGPPSGFGQGSPGNFGPPSGNFGPGNDNGPGGDRGQFRRGGGGRPDGQQGSGGQGRRSRQFGGGPG